MLLLDYGFPKLLEGGFSGNVTRGCGSYRILSARWRSVGGVDLVEAVTAHVGTNGELFDVGIVEYGRIGYFRLKKEGPGRFVCWQVGIEWIED